MVAPQIIAAGIGAVGSLFSSLFGSNKKTTSEIDYVKMRKNAEAAGFNPLTALRAGGGAGFTTTHHPALSSGEFIGEALSGLGNVVAQIDPMRDATAKLEYELKQATLANIQADTASRLRASIGGVPVSTGARVVQAASPLALPKPGQPFGPEVPALPKQDEIVNPFPTFSGIQVPGWLKSGDAWEGFMGDLGTVPATVVNLVGTALHNGYRLGKWIGHGDPDKPKNTAKSIRDYAAKNRRDWGPSNGGDPFKSWGY